MEQPAESINPRKRAAADLDCADSEDGTSKRGCFEASSVSSHLSLLEELYDLEGVDVGPVASSPLETSQQEDLVAEMMKSLEKVIEGEEMRGEGNVSTSKADDVEASLALDFSWNSEEADLPCDAQEARLHEGLACVEDFRENAQIRQLLQASDDELGLPLSSSSSDLEESASHEEWASLVNESNAPGHMNWFDAPFNQFDETPALLSKEMFEPLLLF